MSEPMSNLWRLARWGVLALMAIAITREIAHRRADRERDQATIARLSEAVERLEERKEVVRVIQHETRVERVDPAGLVRPEAGPTTATAAATPAQEPVEQIVGGRLDQAFKYEKIDRDWSADISAGLRAAASAIGATANIQSVECRSSVCRIESAFPDIVPYNRFMDELAGKPAGGDGMVSPYVQQTADGTLRVTSYWVRAGHMKEFMIN